MPYDINIVADTILRRGAARDMRISNLMLQKLLYYAHAWYLVLAKEPLFIEPIEAWVHGPVVPGIFRKFKQFRWDAIDVPEPFNIESNLANYIDSVLDVYGQYSAKQLERLTHSEMPWVHARAGLAADEPSNAVITNEAMRTYYGPLAAHS